jgi:long-chain acyl-CoA synthetase
MEFILNEVEAKGCLTADPELLEKVKTLNVPSLAFIHHVSGTAQGFFPPLGSVGASSHHPDVTSRRTRVTADDLAAILYTSGTTGTPKGAMLTHGNLVSAVKSMLSILPLEPGQRALSFLPFSHIFERATCYVYLACGVSIHFSHTLDRLKEDFREVQPRFFTSVPRTLEKMYDYLEEQRLSRNFFKRRLIGWAMEVGSRYKEGPSRITYRLQLVAARLLVLNHWRKGLGGKVRFLGVGAAALRPEIGRLLAAAGIVPLAGYGMTEASPFISANRYVPGLNNLGTVGLPVPGVEIRIDNPSETGEGEILVRGPNVMKGYYKRPDLTAEVLTPDGWLRTGDVGKMVDKRFLALTDRKKDIFKTTTGKYVAPQAVQNHLTSSPFISQALVTGFNRPFVIAIIVPHFQLLKTWCEEQGIHWTAPAYMVHNIKVIARYQEEIDRLNEALESHERVKKFILSDEEWTVENKELTTSFKPMRAKLQEKHAAQIEKLYD